MNLQFNQSFVAVEAHTLGKYGNVLHFDPYGTPGACSHDVSDK